MEQNLYRVLCKGMKDSHGCAYVVADGPTEAYQKMRRHLDVNDIGLFRDRELESVTLIAKSVPSTGMPALFL